MPSSLSRTGGPATQPGWPQSRPAGLRPTVTLRLELPGDGSRQWHCHPAGPWRIIGSQSRRVTFGSLDWAAVLTGVVSAVLGLDSRFATHTRRSPRPGLRLPNLYNCFPTLPVDSESRHTHPNESHAREEKFEFEKKFKF